MFGDWCESRLRACFASIGLISRVLSGPSNVTSDVISMPFFVRTRDPNPMPFFEVIIRMERIWISLMITKYICHSLRGESIFSSITPNIRFGFSWLCIHFLWIIPFIDVSDDWLNAFQWICNFQCFVHSIRINFYVWFLWLVILNIQFSDMFFRNSQQYCNWIMNSELFPNRLIPNHTQFKAGMAKGVGEPITPPSAEIKWP